MSTAAPPSTLGASGGVGAFDVLAAIGGHLLAVGGLALGQLFFAPEPSVLKPENIVYIDFSGEAKKDDLLMPDKGERTPDAVLDVEETAPEPAEAAPPAPKAAPVPAPAAAAAPPPAPLSPPKPAAMTMPDPKKVEQKVDPKAKAAPPPPDPKAKAAKVDPKAKAGPTSEKPDPKAEARAAAAREAALRDAKRAALLASAASTVGTENRAATSMSGSATGTGAGAGNLNDPEMKKWQERAKKALIPNFTPLPSVVAAHPTYKVVVTVKVAADGTLSDPEVSKSSGDPSFDNAAVNAVLKTGRVAAPPEAWRGSVADGVEVEFRAKDAL